MIIGFTGKSQSGKSIASQALEKNGFTRVGFKDALVQEVADRFPLVLKELNVDVKKKEWWHHDVVRALLKNYGTEVRRADDNNYWVDRIKIDTKGNYVVDDVRFLNESYKIRELGGIVVRLVRDGCDGNSHASEVEQDEIVSDIEIKNDGTIDDLKVQVLALIN